MKIGEKYHDDEGSKFVVEEIFDPNPGLDEARLLRDAGKEKFGESRLVASVPMWLCEMWFKEAGIAHNDNHARSELLKRKLLSGEFDAFRVWTGTY